MGSNLLKEQQELEGACNPIVSLWFVYTKKQKLKMTSAVKFIHGHFSSSVLFHCEHHRQIKDDAAIGSEHLLI